MSQPQWEAGIPANLEAAAADAGEWLDLIERMHALGRWPFSDPQSLEKLRGCRASLAEWLAHADLPQALPTASDVP